MPRNKITRVEFAVFWRGQEGDFAKVGADLREINPQSGKMDAQMPIRGTSRRRWFHQDRGAGSDAVLHGFRHTPLTEKGHDAMKIWAMNRFAVKRFAFCAGLGLAAVTTSQANAQNQRVNMLCAERDIIVRELTGRYGEQVYGMGLAHQNRIVEVYVSEETGSWTITVTSADGTTCLMAAGQHFAQITPEAPGEDL